MSVNNITIENTIENKREKTIIKWKEECKSCQGTGLFVGYAEKNGAAVICYKCKGTGCENFEKEFYTFISQKEKDNITHVYATNPGIRLDPETIEGGVTLKEWNNNASSVFDPGNEIRNATCPAWWYQSSNYKLKPNWKECNTVNRFPDCRKFNMKEKCWEKWDAEYNESLSQGRSDSLYEYEPHIHIFHHENRCIYCSKDNN